MLLAKSQHSNLLEPMSHSSPYLATTVNNIVNLSMYKIEESLRCMNVGLVKTDSITTSIHGGILENLLTDKGYDHSKCPIHNALLKTKCCSEQMHVY